MTTLQMMKLDELQDMALDADKVGDMDHAEIIRILQQLKLGIPENPSLKKHTIATITRLNEELARLTFIDILNIANRLGEPVRR